MNGHPYADFIHRVARPARYVGGEFGQVQKDPRAVRARVCLAFPDLYDVGMSHLGTRILYATLNANPGIAAERAFTPWPDMEAELRARGRPLVSLETATPLRDFDVVGISLQYELTATNVLTLLDLGGVPLRAADRGDDAPLVLAGGPVATHPEPFAPFFDAFFLGDAEEDICGLVLDWARMAREKVPRRERLARLAERGHVYVPSLYRRRFDEASGRLVVTEPMDSRAPLPIRRALVEDLARHPFPALGPEPLAEAIFDRMSVEIARGCTEGCRFCQAGSIYRPVRERHPRDVIDTVLQAVDEGGFDEASLTSLSTADYSCISPLIAALTDELRTRHVSLSVSSLRAYGLDEGTMGRLAQGRIGGLTFAPEAGTQRMRDVVNKNVSEADILEAAARAFEHGWSRIKLYFMIGLPGETPADVAGIVETTARVRDAGLRHFGRRRLEVTASVSSHVPKPHTPFQWCAMDPPELLRRKQALLSDEARRARLRLRTHDVRTSHLEGLLARGDIRMADVIEYAWRRGARFDGWDEHLRYELWLEALDEIGIDTAAMLAPIPLEATLPWSHIDVLLEPKFLRREYRRAMRAAASPPCGKPAGQLVHHRDVEAARADQRKLVCYHCGLACDLVAMRARHIEALESLQLLVPASATESGGADSQNGQASGEREPARSEALAARPRRRRAPPPRPEQGPAERWRFVFAKLPPAHLLGHLDLVRTIPRALRRAGVPLRYTRGFNPHPVMTFAPALPLGWPSLAEFVEVQVVAPGMPSDVLARLEGRTATGLRFTAAARLDDAAPAPGRLVGAARWALALKPEDARALRDHIERLAAVEQWPVERVARKSGRVCELDLKRAFVGVAPLCRDALRGALAGWFPDAVAKGTGAEWVGVELALAGPATVRPDEFAALLLQRPVEPLAVVRVALLDRSGAIVVGGTPDDVRQAEDRIAAPVPG